jgi:hypothetical protein
LGYGRNPLDSRLLSMMMSLLAITMAVARVIATDIAVVEEMVVVQVARGGRA